MSNILKVLPLRNSSKKGDIFIFTSHRSGNTWLTEMFGELPYSRIIKEPFSPAKIPMMKNYFQPRRTYLDLSPSDSQKIVEYLSDIQQNNVLRLGYDPRHEDFKLITSLNVFSMTYASNMAPLVERELNGRILYLVRHPIAQALSKLRNQYHMSEAYGESGWHDYLDVYLNSEHYANTYLKESLIKSCWSIAKNGSDLEKYVLHWCFENIELFTLIKENKWLLVSYEELVANLEETLAQIGKHFHLPFHKVMSKRQNIPSTSSTMSTNLTKEQIEKENPDYLVSRWQKNVSEDEVKSCFQIIDKFGIDLYLHGEFFMNSKYEFLKFTR